MLVLLRQCANAEHVCPCVLMSVLCACVLLPVLLRLCANANHVRPCVLLSEHCAGALTPVIASPKHSCLSCKHSRAWVLMLVRLCPVPMPVPVLLCSSCRCPAESRQ